MERKREAEASAMTCSCSPLAAKRYGKIADSAIEKKLLVLVADRQWRGVGLTRGIVAVRFALNRQEG
jgi:hypothetical protein